MKNQALFSSKDKYKKNLECRLLQLLFRALKVNLIYRPYKTKSSIF